MIPLIFISIIFGALFWLKTKSIANPTTMFCFLWATLFFLYELKLLDYYEIENRTLFVYYVQIFAFVIGSLVSDAVAIVRKKGDSVLHIEKDACKLNCNLVYILSVVTIIYLITISIGVIASIIAGNDFNEIYEEGDVIIENNSTGIMVLFKYFIVDPVTILISPVAASAMFASPKEKSTPILVVLNIIIVVLHTFQHGGRDMLVVFAISYLFAYLVCKNKNRVNKVGKILFVLILVVTLGFTLWVSKMRGIDDIGESLYYYFSGAIPNLQTCTDLISFDDMTLGTGMLYGILYPIFLCFLGVGIFSKTPSFLSNIADNFKIPQQITKIGQDTTINAHVGLSYYFYADGGIPFVFIGCFVLGFAAMTIFEKAKQENDNKNMVLYLFAMIVTMMSFIRLQIVLPGYALALFYLCTIIYRKRKI